jgi:hypothetical protein
MRLRRRRGDAGRIILLLQFFFSLFHGRSKYFLCSVLDADWNGVIFTLILIPDFSVMISFLLTVGTVGTGNNLHATVVRLQLILFSKDIGAF